MDTEDKNEQKLRRTMRNTRAQSVTGAAGVFGQKERKYNMHSHQKLPDVRSASQLMMSTARSTIEKLTKNNFNDYTTLNQS